MCTKIVGARKTTLVTCGKQQPTWMQGTKAGIIADNDDHDDNLRRQERCDTARQWEHVLCISLLSWLEHTRYKKEI